MRTSKLYAFYFMYGVINSIAIQMLPLVLSNKGYSSSQVALVLSFVFLAALFQPIIGILTKVKFGSKSMLQILLVVMVMLALLIFVISDITLMIITVLVFSIARLSISPIYDSYTTMASREFAVNYGLVRSGASLGFGTGMAIYTVIASVFNFDYPVSFIFVSILAMIAIVVMSSLPHEKTAEDIDNSSTEQTDLFKTVLLILIYMLYFGALSIRISYLSTYYVEFGYTTSFISMATFFMVIPEIIFLPLYNRLFAKYNKTLLLFLAILLGIAQMTMYICFTDYPFVLLFVCLFNGFQIMIFFPTFFGLLQDSLGRKNSSFGFVINMTIQSLFVGIFNLAFIRPLIIRFNSTLPIFGLVICLQVLSFIPLAIYYFKYQTKK